MRFFINFRFDCFIANYNSNAVASPLDFFEFSSEELSSPINIFPKSDILQQIVILPIWEMQRNRTIIINDCCLIFVCPKYKIFNSRCEKSIEIDDIIYDIKLSLNHISVYKNGNLLIEKYFGKSIQSYQISKKKINEKSILFISLVFDKYNYIIILKDDKKIYSDFVLKDVNFNKDDLENTKIISYNVNCFGFRKMVILNKDNSICHLVKKKNNKYVYDNLDITFKFLQAIQFKAFSLTRDMLSSNFSKISNENLINYFKDFDSFDKLDFIRNNLYVLFKNDKVLSVISFDVKNNLIYDIKRHF